MSAFGYIICPYCNEMCVGEAQHQCKVESLKERIDSLKDKLSLVKVGLETISELGIANHAACIKCAEKILELVEYNNKLIQNPLDFT